MTRIVGVQSALKRLNQAGCSLMCDSSGMKVCLMKVVTSSSEYDSASSRAHAPQAGAAEKSINKGLFCALASASAASASFNQLTSIDSLLFRTPGISNVAGVVLAIIAQQGARSSATKVWFNYT